MDNADYALFQRGDFTLHSGEKSGIKIDCDALTDADLDTIAWMLTARLRVFGRVEGVPQGGLRLAAAMERYARRHSSTLLIVDDVLTSGGSMEEHRAGRTAIGAVIFARRPPPSWVIPLFTVTPLLIDGYAKDRIGSESGSEVAHNDGSDGTCDRQVPADAPFVRTCRKPLPCPEHNDGGDA